MQALVTLLALLAPQNPAPAAAVDWGELMRRFRADASAMQQSGAALDLAALKLEKLEPGEFEREIAKRESAFFGDGWYEMLWVLAQSAGLQVAATPDVFQLAFQRATIGSLAARYMPQRKSILIDETKYTSDARFDQALLHALGLASLDQRPGGLSALRTGVSTDELLCSRGWIEGQAELCARRASGAEVRAGLSPFEERTGMFALVDLAGLAASESARPANGTQLLHGAERPAPLAVALELSDPAGTKLLREDVLGELGLRLVLSMAGAHPVGAIAAGLGLRGDRLRLWKYGERERAFAWRLVFMSESDASELEALLGPLAKGTRTRHAQVLDWCFATRPELEADLAKLLAALPIPPAPSADEAKASAAWQEARLARHPHMQGERWLLPELDLAWKLPAGWLPTYYQAEAIVYLAAPDAGFRDNLTFREYALPSDATPEKVLEGARKTFVDLAGTKLLRAELVTTPAGRGVLVEFTQSNSGRELHQLELQLVLPGKKQSVTATLLESHWKAAGAGVEKLLAATDRIRGPLK